METQPPPSAVPSRPQRLWYAELFGNVRIDYGPHTVAFRSKAAAHLIAYLLAHPRHEESREKIQGLFWPDEPQDDGANIFRVTLSRLRTGLMAFSDNLPVEINATTVRVDPRAFFCDLLEFDRHLAQARQEEDHRTRMIHLAKAVGFYRDTLMRDCDYLWIHQVRLERENKYLAAVRELFHDAEARGRKADAVDYAQRILNEDPYDTELNEWIGRQRRAAFPMSQAKWQLPELSDEPGTNAGGEAESVFDSLDSLKDWIESPEEATKTVLLPAVGFHLTYARTVCRILELAKSQSPRSGGRLPVSWHVEPGSHTTTFEIMATGRKLVLRPDPSDRSFAQTGLHAPFFIEPTASKLTNDDLNQEYANFKQAVKSILGVFTPEVDQELLKEFVKASQGQLTLLLYRLSQQNPIGKVNRKTAAGLRDLVEESERGWRQLLTSEPDGAQALDLVDRWRGVNTFLTPEVADFIFGTGFEDKEALLMPVAQVRRFAGRKHVRIPQTPANPPANLARLADIAMESFFRAACTREEISNETLRFISETSEYYDGKINGRHLDKDQINRIAANLRRVVDTGRRTTVASQFIDSVINSMDLTDCDNGELEMLYSASISVNPSGNTINTLISEFMKRAPDGPSVGRIAGSIAAAKKQCIAPKPFSELLPDLSNIESKAIVAVFSFNLAVSHCFYGNLEDAAAFMKFAEAREGSLDDVTSIAGLFIKAKTSDVKRDYRAAADLYRNCATALTPLGDARLVSYTRYQEDRVLIRLNEGNYARIRRNLLASIELGHENLIIGHLINAILTTENGGSRSVMIGKLQQFNSALPIHVLRQFQEDIEQILDYSIEDEDIDLSLVRQGSRMTDGEFEKFVRDLF